MPIADAHNECLSASWIIFLNRVASGAVELTALDQLDSMKRLIESAFAADGRLSLAGFFRFEADRSRQARDRINSLTASRRRPRGC
ncbi:hypothetical protein [Bradyrhizobium sp. CCBAU 11386]|uniref:hypothetical protein n=1 Tax=Bradyrhizobium sp. CCBAU 11386 TaxID=1630837 RepID=UPI0023025046|nr:hypothetical protein [Bradyrhizobium sp. CCBAU 11386]